MAEILTPRALASDANCSANGFQTLCSTPAGLASNRIHSIEAKPSRRAQSSSSTPPRIKTPTRIFFARSFPHRPLARNPANRSFMRIEKSLRKSNGDRPPLLTTPRDESAKLSAVLSQSQRHDGSHRSMLTLAPSDGETAVFVGYVSFPLTLALSLRERAGVRGKQRSKRPCACELPSAFDSPRSSRRFSLSLRERAGVRDRF